MSNIFRIGQSKAKKIKKEDVNVTYFSAPRRVEAPSRHRCDSCPSGRVFEAARTESSDRAGTLMLQDVTKPKKRSWSSSSSSRNRSSLY